MKGVSRRSVIGIAAGAVATGVVGTEARAIPESTGEKADSEPERPVPGQTDSIYKFRMATAPVHRYGGSSIREHKLHDFPVSSSLSASLIDLAEGDLREPHWHPNSDEWLFVMAGEIRMTIVDGEGVASRFDCGPEDVAFVPQGFGHYVENVGDATAKLMLIHNHADFTTVNLSEWVAGGSTRVFAATLNMPLAAFDNAPKKRVFIGNRQTEG